MEEIKQLLENNDSQFDNKNVNGLKENIEAGLRLAEKAESNYDKTQLYYSIATCLGNIFDLTFNRLTDIEKEENLEKQIFYFRMAIDSIDNEKDWEWNRLEDYLTDEFTDNILKENEVDRDKKQLYAQLFVNLGNCYDTVYRPIDAIYCYKRALKYVPNFPMATGNKGLALIYYSQFFLSGYGNGLRKLAYISLKEALMHKTYLVARNPIALQNFEEHINKLKKHYEKNIDWLESAIECDKSYGSDKQEEKYKIWVAGKGLFLNPTNDDNPWVYSINDILHLPSMIYEIDDDHYKYAGLFNQIKQEFVSTRYLFYKSSVEIGDAHFSDRGNIILNTLDYSNESYYNFLQKTCFKSLHSILDRVAFFINDYFDLGIEEGDVSFRIIWKDRKHGRNGYEFKRLLTNIMNNNFALKGLYWLAKDIQQENYKTIKPHDFNYKDFRNYLEHKYVKTLKDFYLVEKDRYDTLAYYVTESELYNANLELLRLTRAIIITLIAAIDINEQGKREAANERGDIVPTMGYDIIEDDWKF